MSWATRSSSARRDEALLGPVVQVPLQPAAGLVTGGHDAGARRRELRPAVRVRDRGGHQLGETDQPLLGLRRERTGCRLDRDRAPQPTLDEDRAADLGPDSRLARTSGVASEVASSSNRAARPVARTPAAAAGGSGRQCVPRRSGPLQPRPPIIVPVPSGSNRAITLNWAPVTVATSSATAANTTSGETPSATSVATRRRAACSSAIRRSSERASAFAIAVATSSVNLPICDSVSGGKGSSLFFEAAITPHSRPATTIGQPTDERMPSSRASLAIAPVSCPRSCPRGPGRPSAAPRGRCWRRPG